MLRLGSPSGDNRSYRTSFRKIHRHMPEFRCRWPAETGAHQLRVVFAQVGMTDSMFNFRAFTRLKQLDYLIRTRQIDEDFFWRWVDLKRPIASELAVREERGWPASQSSNADNDTYKTHGRYRGDKR